jgi:hypothetical protein
MDRRVYMSDGFNYRAEYNHCLQSGSWMFGVWYAFGSFKPDEPFGSRQILHTGDESFWGFRIGSPTLEYPPWWMAYTRRTIDISPDVTVTEYFQDSERLKVQIWFYPPFLLTRIVWAIERLLDTIPFESFKGLWTVAREPFFSSEISLSVCLPVYRSAEVGNTPFTNAGLNAGSLRLSLNLLPDRHLHLSAG